jgi:hypothetical protein
VKVLRRYAWILIRVFDHASTDDAENVPLMPWNSRIDERLGRTLLILEPRHVLHHLVEREIDIRKRCYASHVMPPLSENSSPYLSNFSGAASGQISASAYTLIVIDQNVNSWHQQTNRCVGSDDWFLPSRDP